MIPLEFEYSAPTSIAEAVRLLVEHGEDAKVLAGGHSLIPLMKLRLAAPSHIVDLGRIPDMSYIRDADGNVAIGAMSTHVTVQSSPVLRRNLPMVADAASQIGDVQVRNRGTIGGTCAHGDPASDMPAVMVALQADFIVRGPAGERAIRAIDFFEDIWTTAVRPDEVLTEVRLQKRPSQRRQAYYKFRQRAADWAIVGAAVSVEEKDGLVDVASVVLSNVGPTPVHAVLVERALVGRELTLEVVREASEYAADGLTPSGELKASPEYKLHLARVVTRRALESTLVSEGKR